MATLPATLPFTLSAPTVDPLSLLSRRGLRAVLVEKNGAFIGEITDTETIGISRGIKRPRTARLSVQRVIRCVRIFAVPIRCC